MEMPDRKVMKLMEEYAKTNNLTKAALNADMDRKTARKYVKADKLPLQMKKPHDWRTREDPFAEDWPECEAMLEDAPELQGKHVFGWLCEKCPGKYQEGQLRTFQRRVKEWRVKRGPDKDLFFPQKHTPGEKMATDWTHCDELGITINGKHFAHMLCHTVLTYSNWECVTLCHSESLLSVRQGVQNALFRLGRIPKEHWTDNSSAATHNPEGKGKGERGFNREYLDLMGHFGMEPRTIQIDSPNENGDVEALNGALKNRIKQHLLLRGSRDFASEEEYLEFLEMVVKKANSLRTKRLAEEMAAMPKLAASRLAEYREYRCKVGSSGTISVERRVYSVPSRLKGEKVVARRYDDRLEILYGGKAEVVAPWVSRDKGHHVDYRHVISSLARKPGAFRNYLYREDLFPSEVFRWAWESLCSAKIARKADQEYLLILEHAATTMECEVEAALCRLRLDGRKPSFETVRETSGSGLLEPPDIEPFCPDLGVYDSLTADEGVSS